MPADRDGDLELWPRRSCPETAGPHLERELSRPEDLRTLRAQIRAWAVAAVETSHADGGIVEDLVAVLDELATNGLRHGRAPVLVRAVRAPQWLLLDVSDSEPSRGPEPAVDRDPARGGMGLRMVAHLTADRGWTVTGGRKHVWVCFVID